MRSCSGRLKLRDKKKMFCFVVKEIISTDVDAGAILRCHKGLDLYFQHNVKYVRHENRNYKNPSDNQNLATAWIFSTDLRWSVVDRSGPHSETLLEQETKVDLQVTSPSGGKRLHGEQIHRLSILPLNKQEIQGRTTGSWIKKWPNLSESLWTEGWIRWTVLKVTKLLELQHLHLQRFW